MGEPRLSRPQTVKRIWDYVKARDLQDPADRRFIRCDEQLRAVFHTDRLHMFTYVHSHPSAISTGLGETRLVSHVSRVLKCMTL